MPEPMPPASFFENHGMIPGPLIAGSHLVAGLNQMPVLRESGDWEDMLPLFEQQRKYGLESNNCVQFSFLSNCETLGNYYNRSFNLSDRFLYWASGCTANGNTYENCYLGFKRNGSPTEEAWPWTQPMTRAEYGKEPPQEVKDEAEAIFKDWDILTPVYAGSSLDQLTEALKKGPLWACNFNHSFVIYRIDNAIRVFDTYPDSGMGKGSFPLSYLSEIEAAYLLPFTPKSPSAPMPAKLDIPQFCRVTVVFPTGLKRFFFKDGKMMYAGDHSNEVTDAWLDTNVDPNTHVFDKAKAMTITRDQWEQFEVVGFDGKPYPYPIQ